ncbi:MAG: S41 family peptidase [Pseudomonadota bacterium]
MPARRLDTARTDALAMLRRGLLTALLFSAPLPGAADGDASTTALSAELGFEAEGSGTTLTGWGGGPAETLFRDKTIRHTGAASARIERTGEREDSYSSLTRALPATIVGSDVELRGFLRTEGVEGAAGLWVRIDGHNGTLAFNSMLVEARALEGDHDWGLHAISVPLADGARELFFGALLSGQGKVWVDDLALFVDGKPIGEAVHREIPTTVLDIEKEFEDGSLVELASLDHARARRVAMLARVWGFLKYHHPRVTSGESHWDYELFRILPQILGATSDEESRELIAAWAISIGEPNPCGACASESSDKPEDLYMPAPIGWIRDSSSLGAELSGFLRRVHENRPVSNDQFFVGLAPNVGNPVFDRELAYRDQIAPDAGFRLLAVIRLWNIVQYWFPYRDLIDEGWDEVLIDELQRFAAATDATRYKLALLRFIARIGDTHANLWSSLDARPPVADCRWPVHLRFVSGQPMVVATDTARTRLDAGDLILGIDGHPIEELIAAWSPYYAASNEVTRLRDIAHAMPRGPCGASQVRVLRASGARDVRVKRVRPRRGWRPAAADRPGRTFQRLSPEIAYLKLSSVKAAEVPAYLKRAAGTAGLVIDIRNYPSEFVVFALGQHLVAEATPFARFTIGDLSNPGAFRWSDPVILQPAAPRYEGRIAILVDETSLSQAEYTAMAFRSAPGAVVVGSQTAGADGNVSPIALPGGLRTMISGIGVFYPDNRATQRIGIVPDIVVRPTIEGVRQNRDEVLESALRELLGSDVDEAAIRRMARRD